MQTPSNLTQLTEADEILATRNSARSFIYRFLARGFEYPDLNGWNWLTDAKTQTLVRQSIQDSIGSSSGKLQEKHEILIKSSMASSFEEFQSDYHLAFGHAARGRCPINEIDYGEIKADPLFQPHRLADIAAFYQAFGMQLSEDASERQDHVSIECEFMSVLSAKEAYAIEQHIDPQYLIMCRDAQKKFLKEHLGRWLPIFTRQIAKTFDSGLLRTLADFGEGWIESDCASLGADIQGGELFVRPSVDPDASLCASCGINQLPPGAGGEI